MSPENVPPSRMPSRPMPKMDRAKAVAMTYPNISTRKRIRSAVSRLAMVDTFFALPLAVEVVDFKVAVANAEDELKERADYVTYLPDGYGAAEVLSYVKKNKGIHANSICHLLI